MSFDLKKINTFDDRTIEEACADLYVRYSDDFRRFCKSYSIIHFRGMPQMDPDDVFAESFSRLWTKIQNKAITPETITSPLYSYFKGYGINVMREHARKHIVDEALERDATDEDGSVLFNPKVIERLKDIADQQDQDEINDIRKAVIDEQVRNMGKPCGPILEKFWWQDLSMDDIAAELRYSDYDTVKTQKSRCQKKLKAVIKIKFDELGIAYKDYKDGESR